MGGDLAPSLGGRKKIFADLSGKISIFTPKNSDDLFLVINQVFQILCVFIAVSLLYQMSYMTLSSQQKALFQQKNSLTTPIFSSLQAFAPIPQHYFSKYWGDQCMGHPHLKFLGGPSPQSPLGLRPWWFNIKNVLVFLMCAICFLSTEISEFESQQFDSLALKIFLESPQLK